MSSKTRTILTISCIVLAVFGIVSLCRSAIQSFPNTSDTVEHTQSDTTEATTVYQMYEPIATTTAHTEDITSEEVSTEATTAEIKYTEEEMDEIIRNFVHPENKHYAYSMTNADEQQAYDILLEAVLNFDKTISLSGSNLSYKTFFHVFDYITNDYPEIFWVSNIRYTAVDGIGTLIPLYSSSKSQIVHNIIKINAELEPLFRETDGLTDYEKVIRSFEYLASNISYNNRAFNPYDICGPFIEHQAVCAGYAKAFQYLMNEYGIECIYVYGYSGENAQKDEDLHAWNYVKLGNDYYSMDVTWCDLENEQCPYNHWYCLVDASVIEIDHASVMPYSVPACTGTEYNYYIHESYELTEYNDQTLSEFFRKSYEEGKNYVDIRCSDKTVYDQVLSDNSKAWNWSESIPQKLTEISYYYDDNLLTITYYYKIRQIDWSNVTESFN